MSKIDFDLDIDLKELKKQIDAVNGSALPIDIKEGLHNLLGAIRDAVEDKVFYKITSVCKEDILAAFEGKISINVDNEDEATGKTYNILRGIGAEFQITSVRDVDDE